MSRRVSHVVRLILPALLFWFIAAPEAHAYIDPGSSSMIIQIILGVAAGFGLAIATFWRRIRSFFGGKRADEPTSDAPEQPAPPHDTTP